MMCFNLSRASPFETLITGYPMADAIERQLPAPGLPLKHQVVSPLAVR